MLVLHLVPYLYKISIYLLIRLETHFLLHLVAVLNPVFLRYLHLKNCKIYLSYSLFKRILTNSNIMKFGFTCYFRLIWFSLFSLHYNKLYNNSFINLCVFFFYKTGFNLILTLILQKMSKYWAIYFLFPCHFYLKFL